MKIRKRLACFSSIVLAAFIMPASMQAQTTSYVVDDNGEEDFSLLFSYDNFTANGLTPTTCNLNSIDSYFKNPYKLTLSSSGSRTRGIGINNFYFVDNKKGDDGAQDFSFVRFSTDGGITPKFCYFMVTDYQPSSELYIESIEVKWSDAAPCGADLWLNAGENAAFTTTDSFESIGQKAEVTATLEYSMENGGITLFKFPKRVKYLALTPLSDAVMVRLTSGLSGSDFARISYIKVHFVKDWQEPGVTIPVQISCDSPLSTEWRLGGVQLENMVTLPMKDEENRYTAEELGLKFYIKPEFTVDPSLKPDISGQKPDGISDQAWSLYQILESEGLPYDGYLSSSEPIDCAFTEYGDGSNLLEINAPCSGVYTLYLESDNPLVEANKVALNLWPGISNIYGTDDTANNLLYEMSLNRQPVDVSAASIEYPYADPESDLPFCHDSISLHVPGLYDAEYFYRWSSTKDGTPAEVADEDFAATIPGDFNGISSDYPLSMGHLSRTGLTSDTLELLMVKNGAVTPVSEEGSAVAITLKLADKTIVTSMREIEACSTEEGVKYFNLNGQSVPADHLVPGIYIRWSPSGTRKVVIG